MKLVRRLLSLAPCLVCFSVAFLPLFVVLWCSEPTAANSRQEGAEQPKENAKTILGHEQCLECHKAEVAAWQKSSHATKSYQLLSDKKATEFVGKVGGGTPQQNALCTTCHGTQQHTGDQLAVLPGNTCESCHGGAGPKSDGWFSVHSNYGEGIKDRAKETKEHREARIAACQKHGMRMPSTQTGLYALAKNCFECHTVTNEALVNKTQHPPATPGFDFVVFAQGEVRHNYQLDQNVNAEASTLWMNPQFGEKRTAQQRKRLMYVVGLLAELEVTLRKRGAATVPGRFATTAAGRLAALNAKLTLLSSKITSPEIKSAQMAVLKVFAKVFAPPGTGDKKLFGDAADAVAAAAEAFVDNHPDGSKLAAIAPLIPKNVQGTAP